MITRILGEGQYEIADSQRGVSGELDAVRDLGAPVPGDVGVPLDLILPDEGTSRRHM